MLKTLIKYFLANRLVTLLLLAVLVGWGIVTAPFGWNVGVLPSDPVAVDAIPDIGENQQIVFTNWPGRSPQDIEDQITYPLIRCDAYKVGRTVQLLDAQIQVAGQILDLLLAAYANTTRQWPSSTTSLPNN